MSPWIFITDILVYFLVGVGLAIPLLYLNILVAKPLGLIDWPKARGVTEDQVPIVGSSLVLLTLTALIFLGEQYGVSSWFTCAAGVIGFMGFLDDKRPLSALDKIFLQVICAIVVVTLDPNVYASITEKYGFGGACFAVFFIVGLTNAVNFIDGIDGLAGLVLFVSLSGLLFFSAFYQYFATYSWLTAFMMGMLIPFFYINVFKRKGFLGNTGSYFFSFSAAVLHLSLPIDTGAAVSRFAVSALCFIVPIADASMVILVRMLSLRSPFQADKGHLHHRLVQSSIPLRFILLNFAIVASVSVISSGFLVHQAEGHTGYFPVFLCVGNVIITSALIFLVEHASRLRIYSYFRRLDNGEPIYFLKYKLKSNNGKKLKKWQLKRIEALVSAEIRVSDLCATEEPDNLFITIRTQPDPLKGICARLDALFLSQKGITATVIETGEFLKSTSMTLSPARQTA